MLIAKNLRLIRLLPVVALLVSAFSVTSPASANVSRLRLLRRTCGTIDAVAIYDSFSEGRPAYYAVFAVDLNGDGVFGEASEPTQYVRVIPGANGDTLVEAQLLFDPLPEGSTIAVTVYEVDSLGRPVSKQVAPVSYQCTHRPVYTAIPSDPKGSAPTVSVIVRIAAPAVQVYSGASINTDLLGGLLQSDTATVTGINRRGDWVQIDYLGQPGWLLWKTQAVLLGPYATLPVLPNFEDTQK